MRYPNFRLRQLAPPTVPPHRQQLKLYASVVVSIESQNGNYKWTECLTQNY